MAESAAAKTILIRADGDQTIGMGHIMRCLGLAQELVSRDYRVCFVSSRFSPNTESLLKKTGADYQCSQATIGSAEDLDFLVRMCRAKHCKFVVVDGYEFGSRYLTSLRESDISSLLWTDYLQAPDLPVDIILDQTPSAREQAYENASLAKTVILGGLDYVVLRSEFLECKGIRRERERVGRVLVTFGGADPAGATFKVLQALVHGDYPVSFDVVVGPANSQKEALTAMVEARQNFHLHIATQRMADLIASADLAVSAAGTSLWEFAYAGLPTLASSIADNQIPLANSLEELGCSINLGGFENFDAARFSAVLDDAIKDPGQIRIYSQRMMDLVDGHGRGKVVDAIETVLSG